jgi:hypothetical protein
MEADMIIRRLSLAAAVAVTFTVVVCRAQTRPVTRPSYELAREFLRLARENLAGVDDQMLIDMGNADLCAALANLGQVEQARRLATGMKSYWAGAFASIAESQADRGDRKGAVATLHEALVAAATKPKPEDLDELGSAMARLGDPEGASELAARMPPSAHQADVLAHLAVAQAKAGNMAAARKSFMAANKALKNSNDEFPAIQPPELVELQLKVGDFDGAKNAVQDLSSKADMANGYALLGRAAAAKRDRNVATSYLDKAKSLLEQASADEPTVLEITGVIDEGLALLADKTAKEAALARLSARRTALEATDPGSESQPELLADLAIAQRQAGDPAAADATMKSALAKVERLGNSRGERTHAQWVVANAVAESGDVPGAMRLIEQAMKNPIDPVETGFVAAHVAGSLARLPTATAAHFQWIPKLPDPRERGLAYASAAFGLRDQNGHVEE